MTTNTKNKHSNERNGIKVRVMQFVLRVRHFINRTHPLVLSRLLIYAAIEVFMVCVIILTAILTKSLSLTVVAGCVFLGVGYFALLFYRANKLGNIIALVGLCEERCDYHGGLISEARGALSKSKRLYEYRVLVQSKNGSPSYIYLILPEYNRMREGGSYQMLFFRSETETYNEKNLITFRQLAQDVDAVPTVSNNGTAFFEDGGKR